MNSALAEQHRKGSTAFKDLLLILATTILVFAFAVRFDVFGLVARLLLDRHSWIDEVLIVLPLLAFAFGVFSLRRWQELKDEIAERTRTAEALRRSEERFRGIFEGSAIGVGLMSLDRRPAETNPALAQMVGYAPDELRGMSLARFTHPDDVTADRTLFQELTEGKRDHYQLEKRYIRKDGQIVWGYLTVSLLRDAAGEPQSAIAMVEDITLRKRAEEELDRFFSLSQDILCIAGVDGFLKRANPAAQKMLGYTNEELTSTPYLDFVHPEDLTTVSAGWDQLAKGTSLLDLEGRFRCKDGSYKWLAWTATPIVESGIIYAVGRDITERKRYEGKLSYLATHDPLTGLPNRRTLEESLNRARARARRGVHSSLLFLDLDDFKLVNDTLGHNAGDRALVILTRLIQGTLRAEDLLVRLGGDEFAALLEGTEVEVARLVAERVRRAVETFPLTMNGINFKLSLSIGLVDVDGNLPPVALLSRADVAMYTAKGQGGNRVVFA